MIAAPPLLLAGVLLRIEFHSFLLSTAVGSLQGTFPSNYGIL
jgi:hypothetical protein